jgi:hypothetical protein
MVEPPADMLEPQAHHELPWKHRNFFARRGMNVNDVQYGRWVEGVQHRRWSREYTRAWDEFVEEEREATAAQILAHLAALQGSGRFPSQ